LNLVQCIHPYHILTSQVTNPLPQLDVLTSQHTALLAELEGLKESHQFLEGELEAVRAERDAARAVAAANLATSMKVGLVSKFIGHGR
jgi:hypothetical protein